MAIYNPNYRYIEAKEVIEKLGNSKKDQAIKYYIDKNKEWKEETEKELKEYKEFFRTLNSFLPRSNIKLK